MNKEHYRYVFAPTVPPEEVEGSLLLALFAAESLHGEAQVCLDAVHYLSPDGRTCVVDAGTEVGRDLNRVFTGFLRREFGEEAFQVERVSATDSRDFRPVPSGV